LLFKQGCVDVRIGGEPNGLARIRKARKSSAFSREFRMSAEGFKGVSARAFPSPGQNRIEGSAFTRFCFPMEILRRASLAAAAALALTPVAVSAQTAAAAAPNPLGPPIAGICVFARDVAVGNSKAGQATDARLRVLAEQVKAELTPESKAILAENNAISAPGASLTSLQRQTRVEALQKRAGAFDQLRQERTAQLQESRKRAVDTILQRMNEVLGPIASSRHCSIILERSTTYGSNPAMDLTPAVVQALDTRLPTITFDLAPPTSVKR
jgi:Skp family chaperone for outer membrane proteins